MRTLQTDDVLCSGNYSAAFIRRVLVTSAMNYPLMLTVNGNCELIRLQRGCRYLMWKSRICLVHMATTRAEGRAAVDVDDSTQSGRMARL